MSIRQRGPNSWQVRVYNGQPGPNSYDYRTVRGSEQDARRVEAEMKAAIGTLPALDGQRHWTVSQYADIWYNTYVKHKAPRTATGYHSALKSHIVPLLGNIKLHTLTPLHIQRFINRLQDGGANKEPLTPSTISHVYTILRAMLNNAAANGIIRQTPCKSINIPRVSVRYMRIMTKSEAERFADVCLEAWTPTSLLCYTALYTGMRLGEILQLEWCNVDLRKDIIQVRAGGSRQGFTKTPHSVRDLPIPDALHEVLFKLQEASKGKRYVFTTRAGSAIKDRNQIGKGLARLLELSSISIEGFTFHDLRHTHASRLSIEGVPVAVICRHLGHARITTTGIYMQDDGEGPDKIKQALDGRGNNATKRVE